MNEGIRSEVQRHGITRLCHFTPTRNLVHIVTGEGGLVPRSDLEARQRHVFTPTDPERHDRYPDHHSCTVEYPNLWYFDEAKDRDVVFRDWVLLFLNPMYLWAPGTKFCPHNAALHGGRDVAEGAAAFRSLFAASVTGSGSVTRIRSTTHLLCSPTDDQAEVLIPGEVPLADMVGMAVPSVEAAAEHWVRMQLLGISQPPFPFVVAPDLFNKHVLRSRIVAGERPKELPWRPST